MHFKMVSFLSSTLYISLGIMAICFLHKILTHLFTFLLTSKDHALLSAPLYLCVRSFRVYERLSSNTATFLVQVRFAAVGDTNQYGLWLKAPSPTRRIEQSHSKFPTKKGSANSSYYEMEGHHCRGEKGSKSLVREDTPIWASRLPMVNCSTLKTKF